MNNDMLENNRHARRAKSCIQSRMIKADTKLYLSGAWVVDLGVAVQKFLKLRGPSGIAPVKPQPTGKGRVEWLYGSSTEDVMKACVTSYMALYGCTEEEAEAQLDAEREARKRKTPTHIVHRYPPHPDTPGKVSEGCARDLQRAAEAYHIGSFAEHLALLRYMGPPLEETDEAKKKRRNKARRVRKERRS